MTTQYFHAIPSYILCHFAICVFVVCIGGLWKAVEWAPFLFETY